MPTLDKIKNWETKWIQRVSRLDNQKYPKMLQYQPRGKRRLGSPLKWLLDYIQLEAETDYWGLNSQSRMVMIIVQNLNF